ncbi:MAG: hypothetical protein AAF617_08465 [Bacteroidota bacterium]
MTKTSPNYKKHVFDKLLDTALFSEINFDTDTFIFYNSGIVYYDAKKFNKDVARARLIRENSSRTSFLDAFIRIPEKSQKPMQFKDAKAFEAHFRAMHNVWDFKNFPYCYSFVSLIQPMSLAAVLRDHKDLDLQQFQHIIFCSITDDADQNDQWLQDYKTVRKYIGNKQQEIDSILSNLMFSEFNGNSKGLGSFLSTVPTIEENDKPKLFASIYKTRQGQTEKATKDAIKVMTEHRDTISVRLRAFLTQIHLVKLEAILVNDELVQLPYPLLLKKDTIQKIPLKLNRFSSNTITFRGIGQRIYSDSLLGKRIKKVIINENHGGIFAVNSPFHHTWLYRIGAAITLLLLSWLAYFLYKLYQPKCIIIGPKGATTIIKNGFKRHKQKKKIQYASFTKNEDTFASIKLKNHFITNEQFPVDHLAEETQWITVITRKRPLFINKDIDELYFDKGDEKNEQGTETEYHEKIRKKYGKRYAISFVPYPAVDTVFSFTMKDDSLQNEYNILAASIDPSEDNTTVEHQNANMISTVFLHNEIPTQTEFMMVCNRMQHNNISLLYINLIQAYSLKTFSPIKVLKQYKIQIDATDDVEQLINHEKAALEKELKHSHKKVLLKVFHGKENTPDTMLSIQYPFFPVNLSLCSKEEFGATVRLPLFDSISYPADTVENNQIRIKIERPSDVTIKSFSIQLVWHPHATIYDMHVKDRRAYAINGENYMDIGNPDTITLELIKDNHQYHIDCQALEYPTNVLDYFYKSTYNE